MIDCERCGHDPDDHVFHPEAGPQECEVRGCDCPEYIEPEDNE